MYKQYFIKIEDKSKKIISHLNSEFNNIRAGRANPSILDDLNVVTYGVLTPIKQIASITVPEAKVILVQPWDVNLLGEIEKAILKSDIGINPSNDGKVIRLPFPALTEDRRKELVKEIWKIAEANKVFIRNERRDVIDSIKKLEKSGDIREDDAKNAMDEVQKIVDKYISEIEKNTKTKEEELMEI